MRKSTLVIISIPLIFIFYFVYVMMGWNIIVSVSDSIGAALTYHFKGFGQYIKLVDDPRFWTSLKNTLLLLLLIPCSIGLGLLLAMMLDQKLKGTGVFRNIYLMPFALSFVITATLWAWMCAPTDGVLNNLLRSIGLGSLTSMWYTHDETFIMTVIIALVWQFSGYTMMILLAGMKSIPQSQLWAAELDGASGFRLYRRVVIPQLKLPILSAFVILMLYAIKSFDFLWVLTEPTNSTFTLTTFMYYVMWKRWDFAYASAIGNVLLVLTLVIVVPYLYSSYRRGEK
jgi:carbohydrate ABC transporter membrane protein 1, CUT1 family (TC 3.A.1.1.-)